VDLIHRRDIKAADDPAQARADFAEGYERDHLTAETAARDGVVDEIVEPPDTRERLSCALHMLAGVERTESRNRNIPL